MQIIYDAGALIAIERRSPRMLRAHRRAITDGRVPIVPTIVLGQVWRGTPREAALARVLQQQCKPHVLDVVTARLGGQLCGATGTSDLAGAVVAVLAMRYDAPIVTSVPDDLRRLTARADREVEIFAV